MPHLHTESGQHDLTASAFIVRPTDEGHKILFHRHKKLGILLQPGGHVELNENPWQAIQHELVEETGYDLKQLQIFVPPYVNNLKLVHSIVHPHPVILSTHRYGYLGESEHFHTDISYAFLTEELPSGVPGEGESTEFFWLNVNELNQLAEGDIVEDVRAIAVDILTNVIFEWWPAALTKFENSF